MSNIVIVLSVSLTSGGMESALSSYECILMFIFLCGGGGGGVLYGESCVLLGFPVEFDEHIFIGYSSWLSDYMFF